MNNHDKKREILDRTARFLLEGYAFNMTDLARDLNISRKTLYNHFHSRRHLLQSTIDHFFEQMGSELEEKIDRDLPFIERGELVLNQLADRIDRIERLCSQKVLLGNQVENQYKRVYGTIKKKVTDFIKEGQTLGWIRPEIPPVHVADLYFSLIMGSLYYQGSHDSYGIYLLMVIQGLMSDQARKDYGLANLLGSGSAPGQILKNDSSPLSEKVTPHLPGSDS